MQDERMQLRGHWLMGFVLVGCAGPASTNDAQSDHTFSETLGDSALAEQEDTRAEIDASTDATATAMDALEESQTDALRSMETTVPEDVRFDTPTDLRAEVSVDVVMIDAGPWRIAVGPEQALGASNAAAVPQADVGPDGTLHVVWLQGNGTAISSAYRMVRSNGTMGPLLTVPNSDGPMRTFPAQFGPRVAAGNGERALVVFGIVTGTAPDRATWHVAHVASGTFSEWATFPAQDARAGGFGEEANVAIVNPTDAVNARGWVNYGYLQPRTDGIMGDAFLTYARSFLSGAMREGPIPTVNPPPPIAPWGKDSRYRAHGGEIWGASQLGQLMVQHGPGIAGGVNGWETIRCSLASNRSAGSPRPLFDRDGRPFLVYTEWEEVAPLMSTARQNYLVTNPRDACRRRVPFGPAFSVSAADATRSDGRFDVDGFGLGDGRLFLAWHQLEGSGPTIRGSVHYTVIAPDAPAALSDTELTDASNATYVTTTRTAPDGGGYLVYRTAAGQIVARRVQRAP